MCECTYVQGETEFMYKISTVWFLCKRKLKILYSIWPVTFSFQDTCHCQMAQTIRWWNYECLVVTVGVWTGLCPFKVRWQCATQHSLKHAVTCWHQSLLQLLSLATRCVIVLWQTADTCSFRCSHKKKFIRVISGDWVGHAVGPQCLFQLPGCVAFNHCQVSSP